MRLDPQTSILLSLLLHGPGHRRLIRDRIQSASRDAICISRESLESPLRTLVASKLVVKYVNDKAIERVGRPNTTFKLTSRGRAEAIDRRNTLLTFLSALSLGTPESR